MPALFELQNLVLVLQSNIARLQSNLQKQFKINIQKFVYLFWIAFVNIKLSTFSFIFMVVILFLLDLLYKADDLVANWLFRDWWVNNLNFAQTQYENRSICAGKNVKKIMNKFVKTICKVVCHNFSWEIRCDFLDVSAVFLYLLCILNCISFSS